jgi:hypothetical protein
MTIRTIRVAIYLLRTYWWSWPLAGVLALVFGGSIVATAHPAHPVKLAGTVAHYRFHYTYFVVTGRDIVLNEQPSVTYHLIGDYTPELPGHVWINEPITLWVDQGSQDAVAMATVDATAAAPGSQADLWASQYYATPGQLQTDRGMGGGSLLLLGTLLIAGVVYLRWFFNPGSAEEVAKVAQAVAGGDYGPRTGEVVALLQRLSGLREDEWRMIGDQAMRQQIAAAGSLSVSAQRLRAAAAANGRTAAVARAHEAAEKLGRANPPMRDGAFDLRRYAATSAGLAAGAVAARDLLAHEDFGQLYAPIAFSVPEAWLAQAAVPAAPAPALSGAPA